MTTTTLNEGQEQAVHSEASNILLLAGPGSGKTGTIARRIQRLIEAGEPPWQIAAITFTNAAAAELQRRIGQPIGFCGTVHSFCLRILQKDGHRIGLPSRLTVMDKEQDEQTLRRAMDEVGCRASAQAVRDMVGHSPIGRSGRGVHTAVLAAHRYVKTCRMNGLLSFDLILRETVRLCCDGLHLPHQWLFWDEYQDTTPSQADLARVLPIANKFRVGDPDQAIFGWNGGSIDGIMELQGEAEVIRLEDNYRSDRRLCAAANRLIAHNKQRIEKCTFPVSQRDGHLEAIAFTNPAAEMAFGATLTGKLPDSWAILLRYNQHVAEWTSYLEGMGIPVAKRRRSERPADWAFARVCLALLADPENDWLAEQFVKAKHGPECAEAAKLKAVAQGASLNALSLHIPADLPLNAYSQTLARCGVSQESVALVEQAFDRLTSESTGADLLLALAEQEQHEPEVGQGVTVTTYHSAKGREWDCVLMPNFEEGLMPGPNAERIEEDRRLAFVGLTRARHLAAFTWSRTRRGYSGQEERTVSWFVKEMGL